MIGRYTIEIYNAAVHYFLTVQCNITVLRGDSASGKSELIRLLEEYNRSRTSSGITLLCDRVCSVLTAEDWESRLSDMSGRIIFIDEGNDFVRTKRFAEKIKGSDNYYVIINRDSLSDLPYSINEIYGLRESDRSKYKNAEQVYNEMYQLYAPFSDFPFEADHVITEDSGSGFAFFSAAFPGITHASKGKSNILQCLREANLHGEKCVAIVDGAAFGSEMDKIYSWLKANPHNAIFAPESFEYLILSSGVVEVPADILSRTYQFADSCKYLSWEQFYTDYLIQTTRKTNHAYQKSMLNSFYTTKGSMSKILRQMPNNLKICRVSDNSVR
jgi:hypothetical protein